MKKEEVRNKLIQIRGTLKQIENNLEGSVYYQDQMYRNLESLVDEVNETIIGNNIW